MTEFGRDGDVYDAFVATLTGAGVNSANDTALFRVVGTTLSPELVAREGAEAPGGASATWKSFTSLSVLAGRGALFTATLSGAGLDSVSDAGLWAEDSSGALQLLFRGGDIFAGKTLKFFTVLDAVSGSPGQRRAWVQGVRAASVIWRAVFTDGTSAIVTTSVP
jgi:hypothetical protein